MNLLYGNITYLAGPIDYSKDGGTTWRKKITPILNSMGVAVLDPTNKKIKNLSENEENIKKRQQLKKDGNFEELIRLGKPIRHADLRMVDVSSFIIAHIDYDIRMTGTYDEIFMADSQQKPVLIVCKQGREQLADWIWWSFPSEHLFDNFDQLFSYLEDIDSGKVSHPRFVLINFKELFQDIF